MKVRGAKITKIISLVVIVCIWLGSALLALPAILFSRLSTIRYQNGQRHVCVIQWPDGPEERSDMAYVYVFI